MTLSGFLLMLSHSFIWFSATALPKLPNAGCFSHTRRAICNDLRQAALAHEDDNGCLAVELRHLGQQSIEALPELRRRVPQQRIRHQSAALVEDVPWRIAVIAIDDDVGMAFPTTWLGGHFDAGRVQRRDHVGKQGSLGHSSEIPRWRQSGCVP
jgi:hypothetical protein